MPDKDHDDTKQDESPETKEKIIVSDASGLDVETLKKQRDAAFAEILKLRKEKDQRTEDDSKIVAAAIIQNTKHWPGPVTDEDLKDQSLETLQDLYTWVKRAPAAPEVDILSKEENTKDILRIFPKIISKDEAPYNVKHHSFKL